ncbi:MAG: DUF3662 domain-containing protein [Eggerthellaceae bacterium]|nr:DUF3662 domain-containing protein [Eggerthellaceae bacterium]
MGIFSRFESKMEDGLEGAAGAIFKAPISPVQISKKAEKAMRREKMVGAGKQYAPTLYTVLVNEEDDKHLFGYYPTIAGETETFLSARAAEEGLTMDGQPLVRFIAESSLKRGKFDVIAELVSAPIIAQLRREEMQRYGLLGKKETPAQAQPAPSATPDAELAAPSETPQEALAHAIPQKFEDQRNSGGFTSEYAQRLAQSQDLEEDNLPQIEAPEPRKQPLPYVPEEEIDRSIDYGEYTFNSQDFEDYEAHGPSAQLIHPQNAESENAEDEDFNTYADLSGFDVEAYNPLAHDSRDMNHSDAEAVPPAVNTHVFTGGAASPVPNKAEVRARLINTTTNRDFDLVGGRLILGRSNSCDISIDDISASRSHAELRLEPQGVWVLTDLGSTNGTKVNDEKITSTSLKAGDRISIGTTDLLFLEG